MPRRLSGQADAGFATLVKDLRDRGRLDRTLVIWMGEFGRTPRINANTGRDHFPRAFIVALAGGGIRGGRVIGATSDGGNDVTNRPVGVADLFCTFCHALGIDPRKENQTPIGRPIRSSTAAVTCASCSTRRLSPQFIQPCLVDFSARLFFCAKDSSPFRQ